MVESHEAKRRTDFCDNCIFWVNRQSRFNTGECRRHAPSPMTGCEESTYWPTTASDDWCGDYSPMLESK